MRLAGARVPGPTRAEAQVRHLAIGASRVGIDPDLLDEITWWRTDDFWLYALAAAVAIIRACSDKRSTPIGEFLIDLGNQLGVEFGGLPP